MDHEQQDADHGVQPLKHHGRNDAAWELEALRLQVANPQIASSLLRYYRETKEGAYRWGWERECLKWPGLTETLSGMRLPPTTHTVRKLAWVLSSLQLEAEQPGFVARWKRPKRR